jgi:hypothetical protein
MEYSIGNGNPVSAGLTRYITGDFSKANSLTFWLDPDSSGRKLNIRLYDTDVHYWYYDYTLNGSDSVTVVISFDLFKANYGTTPLDRTTLNKITLSVSQGSGDLGSGTLYFDNFKFLSTGLNDVAINLGQQIPSDFSLYPNYPNPFNSETVIRYALPNPSLVQITVYNIQGQVVEVLVNQKQEAGIHEIRWDAKNVGAGIYFYRLKTKNTVLVQKCVLLK